MAISKVIYKSDEEDSGTVWMDTTDKTVTAGDMLSGKTALKADGTTATGNIATKTSSDLTASGLTITAPAGYYASSASKSASDENLIASNIKKDVTIFSVTGTYEGSGGGGGTEAEEKDVNFIDYDGTIVYSYTAAEFANLSAMPAYPSHTGLTAQGWNWSLSDAKTYVATYGKLWIGQMYITASGDTEIDVSFPDSARLSPVMTIAVNGTITVDWGDNTTADTVTGTSLTTRTGVSHTYANIGHYTIVIHVTSGAFGFYGSTGQYTLLRNSSNLAYPNRVYANCIRNIRLGSGITSISDNAFYNCTSLESVTIPISVVAIGIAAFYNCFRLTSLTLPSSVSLGDGSILNYSYGLKSIALPSSMTFGDSGGFEYSYALTSATIPSGVTSINSRIFYSNFALTSVIIPNGITSIGGSAFYTCYSLTSVTIPSSVTSIGSSAFSYCYGLGAIHFKSTTPPTVAASNAFTNVPTDCKIYVPTGYLSAYTTASNYPNSSTYTYIEE